MGIIKAVIDQILNGMGIPQTPRRDQATSAMGKCYVTYALAESRERKEEAIEDFFNDMGITQWRGTTMAKALMQVLEAAPEGNTMEKFKYAIQAAPALRSLLHSVLNFNVPQEPSAQPSMQMEDFQMPALSMPTMMPRDERGRFISAAQAAIQAVGESEQEADPLQEGFPCGVRIILVKQG